jgi:hypothetical protein
MYMWICGSFISTKKIWSANRKNAFHNVFWAPNGTRLSARCHFRGPKKLSISRAQPPPTCPIVMDAFFYLYLFGGLECVGHSFAYVAHLWFLRDVLIRTQSAAVASWRATDLATHRNGCCPHQKHYARGRINHRCINKLGPMRLMVICRLS